VSLLSDQREICKSQTLLLKLKRNKNGYLKTSCRLTGSKFCRSYQTIDCGRTVVCLKKHSITTTMSPVKSQLNILIVYIHIALTTDVPNCLQMCRHNTITATILIITAIIITLINANRDNIISDNSNATVNVNYKVLK